MGNIACCGRNVEKEEKLNEFYFNEILQSDTVTSNNDDTDKILYSSMIKKQDFIPIKLSFENVLKQHGKFILNQSINEILQKINPLANKIELKDGIENMPLTHDRFIAPPIKFNTGEIYEGSWNKNNKRDGYGININSEGSIFKGLWDNDKVGNYGLFLDTLGNYYLGDLKNGKSEGNGEMVVKNKIKYVGEFLDDAPNGKGVLENFEENTIYEGEVENCVKNGKGVLKFSDGTKYSGDFKNDKYDGKGILEFADGRKYEGEFHDNKIKGKGKFTWSDGKVYEGEYDDFMRNGNGKYFWDDNKYYEGQWINNKQHGKGTLHYEGKEIKGTFRYGKIIMGNDEENGEL